MITFRTTPKAVRLDASHKIFDASELSGYSNEERAKISFLIYPLTPVLSRELREKHIKKNDAFAIMGLPGTEAVEELDDAAFQEDLLDRIVIEWSGVQGEDGKELSCTKANKVALFDYGYPMLGVCLVKAARMIMSTLSENQETERKNSKTS